MNSVETQARAPVAKLELKWRKVATRLAAKVMPVHFDSGADDDHVVDEFVIRQALRDVLIDLLSTSFISAKEKRYPNSRRRMDLTVGPMNCPIDFAIELKGTGASVEQLAEDWSKMLLFTDATRISILAGIGRLYLAYQQRRVAITRCGLPPTASLFLGDRSRCRQAALGSSNPVDLQRG